MESLPMWVDFCYRKMDMTGQWLEELKASAAKHVYFELGDSP